MAPLMLTFDDGPDPVWTPRILDVLAWKSVPAVFMMTGEHARMHPALVTQVAASGHVLGVHSWSHPHVLTLDSAHQMGQVETTRVELVRLVGAAKVLWWRAPYGESRAALDGYAASRGLTAVGWNAHGTDWGATSPRAVSTALQADLAETPLPHYSTHPTPPGVEVALLHDGRGENHTTGPWDSWDTLGGLIDLLNAWAAQGRSFVTTPS